MIKNNVVSLHLFSFLCIIYSSFEYSYRDIQDYLLRIYASLFVDQSSFYNMKRFESHKASLCVVATIGPVHKYIHSYMIRDYIGKYIL